MPKMSFRKEKKITFTDCHLIAGANVILKKKVPKLNRYSATYRRIYPKLKLDQ